MSKRGTMLHRYFRTDLDRSELSESDRTLLENADKLSDEFLAQFRRTAGIDDDEPFTEEHEINLPGLVPGHPDSVISWRDGAAVVILDFKSGFIDVEEAPSNYQLSDYSALVWNRKPFELCGVAIVQPPAGPKRLTGAIYSADAMPGVIDEIARIYAGTRSPKATAVPGERQCRYCRAKWTRCPEYSATMAILTTLPAKPLVAAIDNETLGRMAEIVKMAKSDSFGGVLLKELARRVEADEMPGWEMKSNGSTREITDLSAAFARFVEAFGGADRYLSGERKIEDDFLACLDPALGRLEAMVKAITGESEAKAVAKLKALLADLTEYKPKKKTPVRKSLP